MKTSRDDGPGVSGCRPSWASRVHPRASTDFWRGSRRAPPRVPSGSSSGIFLRRLSRWYMTSHANGSVTIGEYLASLDFPRDDLPNLDVATIHSLGLAAGRLSSISLKLCTKAGVGVDNQCTLVSRYTQRWYEDFKMDAAATSERAPLPLDAPRRPINNAANAPSFTGDASAQGTAVPFGGGSVVGSVAHTSITHARAPRSTVAATQAYRPPPVQPPVQGNQGPRPMSAFLADTERKIQEYLGRTPGARHVKTSRSRLGRHELRSNAQPAKSWLFCGIPSNNGGRPAREQTCHAPCLK